MRSSTAIGKLVLSLMRLPSSRVVLGSPHDYPLRSLPRKSCGTGPDPPSSRIPAVGGMAAVALSPSPCRCAEGSGFQDPATSATTPAHHRLGLPGSALD